ncbi:ricin B lectin domain-containing protein [Crepidotus variabilis]|uniref:Ricin B lectin domain-containing protein n=1 Tax=Crepidotus variabilis TaxID=179855 RepID=A0A9P6E622_9AGAR|nr:ricin B lectin domain-containing protein [Crepidotus variabilis]
MSAARGTCGDRLVQGTVDQFNPDLNVHHHLAAEVYIRRSTISFLSFLSPPLPIFFTANRLRVRPLNFIPLPQSFFYTNSLSIMVAARSFGLFQLAAVSLALLSPAFAAAPANATQGNSDNAQAIHPGANVDMCLDVRDYKLFDGAPVQLYDCNDTPAQKWVFTKGQTHIQLAGTKYCLDAGQAPANGQQMKIWTCFDDLRAQSFFVTDDDRISLKDQGFCMDVTKGQYFDTNPVQIWQCTDNNWNQVWWDDEVADALPYCQ